MVNGLDVDCLVEVETGLGQELDRDSDMIVQNPEIRERLDKKNIEKISQNLADPVLQSKGSPKKRLMMGNPPQRLWHNEAKSHVFSAGDMAKKDIKFIEKDVINSLFSPKVVRKIIKDDREIEFEAEMSKLNSITLEKRIFKVEERHLHTANVNNEVSDQWEVSRIVADQWGTSNYEQVHDKLNILNELVPRKPQYKLSPKNSDLNVPRGGEPPLGPKIERHSQDIVSPYGGTTPPPPTHEKFLIEHLKPSTINKKGVPPKSPILKNMASGKKTNRGK